MPHRPYIVGNWKMNGSRAMLAEARAIDRAAARYPDVQVALAPPFTLIGALREAVTAMGVGGQDCHTQVKGAHTGDVSAAMLVDTGADFVIVGHSERRKDHSESDATVKAKAEAALTAGLGIIVCVGETLDERDAGKAEAVVSGQVDGSMPSADVAQDLVALGKVAVAYEPVWAIGTGRVAAVSDVVTMHAAIRERLLALFGEAGAKVRILYGGSVNAANAQELLAAKGVGGALVGGASLTAEAFLPIVAAAGTGEV
ncbi:MAG: triose-phosphate isomerase [Novosphingobium sp. 28-62-57]|uniref:triose-phosphate isomerase n=1 Tax=unclassified Novosphingobium TaxID=2644732 RepID=UPI000BC8E0F2|nr:MULTISPECIES: triose-phosphate isomerase [unclassified Novosphingobium]OYW49631.1 MAG: triose-phosphate isomerase [Novosphingobium sp. 12-62-10]OYZ12412.1 MAG: triose-phosphate isomerase [Novosphingobium sp. 28-62-57]OZA34120.1 MAG: triose-phosphate isomerase [Novosphingobium sp. 17-62-9]HQS69533.1 triose-phosphate isomerase [Novosphingobium sp.]